MEFDENAITTLMDTMIPFNIFIGIKTVKMEKGLEMSYIF